MSSETIQSESVSEVSISPERKKQIRDDLTYFQLFAFQGPRITTGDGKRSLGQLNETDVSYEYSHGGGEWNNLAVAMGNHGYVSGQLSPEAEGVIDRFFPLIDPVCPARLQEKNGLIVLETALGDGKISALMVGYANYELGRGRSPIPTGFELIFSDLGAANRFFKGLENDPTTAINEYVSVAIGGIDGGRHAAFGGRYPPIGYLGVRRYNDEMYQAGITVGGVKRVNSWNNISEFADFDEKHKQEKIDSINRSDQSSLLPEIRYKGYEGYSSFSRPEGYLSMVANRQPQVYNLSSRNLTMSETQRNALPAEALIPPGFRRITTPGELAFMTPANEARQFIFGSSHPAYIVKSGERCLFSVGFPFSPVDSGTGQTLSDPSWVEIKKDYQVIVRRGEGPRFIVGTDENSKTITVSLPSQFTEKDGRKHDFSDINGGADKRNRHFSLRLAQSGNLQAENWDTKSGIAVPVVAALGAKAGEKDIQKEGDVATEKLKFDIGAATSVGKVREHNEDSLAVMDASALGEKFSANSGLYVVADGMGGHGGGEEASGLAVKTIQSGYLGGPRPQEDDKLFLQRLINETNKAVFQARRDARDVANQLGQKQNLSDQEKEQLNEAKAKFDMGTTIVAALRQEKRTVLAWVGDSRAYIISNKGEIKQLTRDHSLVANLVAAGQITPEEAAVHPQRNVIYRTIGDKPTVEIDAVTADLKPGDKLLLCCDGLSGMVSDAKMASIVNQARTSHEAVEQLIAAANDAGGQDNISAIVVGNVSEAAPADEKASVGRVINNIAAEIGGGNPDQQKLQQLVTELLSGAVALAADQQKLKKTMSFVLKVAQKYHLDFG